MIIDDHTKGVITENLITEIKERANQTKWFVRTKDSRIRQTDRTKWPSWLGKIHPIELLVVGPEISCRCYTINGLLAEKDRLAEHAYELIYSLIETKDPGSGRIKNLVLTSDKLEVVALLDNFCFVARPSDKFTKPEDIDNIDLVKINWTTAFFAALVYEMLNSPEEPKSGSKDGLKDEPKDDERRYKEMIDRAINNAHEHSGIRIPQVLGLPTDESCQDVSSGSTSRSSKSPRTEIKKVCDWQKMQNDWSDAKSTDKHGIIQKQKRLEIWRPSTDLPGFIVCIKEKRAAIRRIWQKMNSFILREDPPQSLSILLEADPAVGKSFLVERLAKVSGCTLVQCDITQMIERKELLDLFDRVADAQAENSRPVFVFVDEINATLGGSPIYGAFLSPLEAGSYMRNGQRITLKPCIWMFAGTPDGDNRASDNDKTKKEKREDFESRMTMIERIDYKSMFENRIVGRTGIDLKHEAKLEQVYLGAKRINDAFNDVKQIDRDILKAFYELEPEEAPARRIKRLAASLENVQYGRVHKGNCTSLEWQKVIDENILLEHRPEWRDKFDPLKEVEYVDINLS
ncbi:MAG: hypothetical protein RKP20_14060 [Candidatus Competibacter sp.]|nr:hypothetical protein [Candidatus Competibacter sp.]